MPVLQTLNTSLIQSLQSICAVDEESRKTHAAGLLVGRVRSNEVFDDGSEDEDGADRGDDCLSLDFDFTPLPAGFRSSSTPSLSSSDDVDAFTDDLKKPNPFPGGIEPLHYSLRDWMALRQAHQQQPQQQLLHDEVGSGASPAARPTPTPQPQAVDALHLACCKPQVSPAEIELLLRNDPAAVSRPLALTSYKSVYSPILKKTIKKLVRETYTYPLNLAIQYKACNQVLEMLADAAPHVLTAFDGSLREPPIFVFLKHHPRNSVLFDKLLLDCPSAAYMRDRHDNTIAHVGARQGVSVEMMRHMVILNPESLRQRNFHGRTPLELAQQRTTLGTDAVATFLLDKLNDPKYR